MRSCWWGSIEKYAEVFEDERDWENDGGVKLLVFEPAFRALYNKIAELPFRSYKKWHGLFGDENMQLYSYLLPYEHNKFFWETAKSKKIGFLVIFKGT